MKRKADGSWTRSTRRKIGGPRPRRWANSKRRGRRWFKRRVPRNVSAPVPFKALKRLKYSHTGMITCSYLTSVPMGALQFRVNSLYDPDFTGVGAKPLWTDQLAAMYNKYRVHGLKYKLTLSCVDNNRLTQIAVSPSNSSTVETVWQTMAERAETRIVAVPPVGATPKIISGYIPAGRPYGLTKRQMKEDEEFITTFGTNPTKASFLSLYGVTMASSAVIDFRLDMTFLTECMDRKKVTGS